MSKRVTVITGASGVLGRAIANAALARGEIVDPVSYYFRTAVRLRTAAPGLSRLNALLAVATGERAADRVRLRVFELG